MPDHLLVGAAASAVGLALLTWAWCGLRAYARNPETGLRSVRTAVATWSAPLVLAPPLLSGDAWSYVATGYLTGHGRSPYVATASVLPLVWRSAVNARWQHTPSPYGPLPHVWGGLASQSVTSPWLLMLVYRLFALLGLALLVWAVPRIAARCGLDGGQASWLVLASPFMLVSAVGGMHVDVVVAGLCAAALVLARPGSWRGAAVLVGLAASVKVPGGIAAVGVVLLSLPPGASVIERVRRTAHVALLSLGTLVALGVTSGLGLGWVSALGDQGRMSGRLSLSHDAGWLFARLAHLIRIDRLFGSADIVGAVEIAGAGALVIGATLLLARHRPGHDGRTMLALAQLMLAATVLLPVVHYWYYLWCLPLLACAPVTRQARGALVGLTAALGISSVADAGLHTAFLVPATAALLIGCAAAGYLLTPARERAPALVS